MALRLYNTASRQKEDFRPLQDGQVGIYVCGVTVYDLCHIGHARSTIVFDVLVRYLRALGFQVTYVRNFTDVDDKIIERARKLGKDPAALAQEFIEAFHEDMGRLGVLHADVEPRATEHIAVMIETIALLVERGWAYVEGSDVFFEVTRLDSYGRLSGRSLEDMQAGSRIAVDEKKRHPADFALWKGAKPGEPQWPSPWGPGRPGWHIECSVMSSHYLGPCFDIHGGGQDLLFPHHENERAQSLAVHQGEFANYWVHNGFVTVDSEKMSKSLGNFLTIRDALREYPAEVLRLFLLSKHYRSPLDFTRRAVLDLQSGLLRIYRTLERLNELLGPEAEGRTLPLPAAFSEAAEDSLIGRFVRLMDDDLNTAGAVGLIFEKVRELNRLMDSLDGAPDEAGRAGLLETRREILLAGRTLGLLEGEAEELSEELARAQEPLDSGLIESLLEERAQARAHRDWGRADEIRERLKAMGVVIEDGPQGTRGDRMFEIVTDLKPCGDQPEAIDRLAEGLQTGLNHQVLLGVTGSGKTFTMAHVIARVQRATLVIAPNKTLAAQLFGELRRFFPRNAVEYFVSYYDYYQPEAYIPQSDTYIQKDAHINEQIDKMRHAATRSLLDRDDVIIVASRVLHLRPGLPRSLSRHDPVPGAGPHAAARGRHPEAGGDPLRTRKTWISTAAVSGCGATCWTSTRSTRRTAPCGSLFFGDEIESHPGNRPPHRQDHPAAAAHHHLPRHPLRHHRGHPGAGHPTGSRTSWTERIEFFRAQGKLLEAQRIEERTRFDLEMMLEIGYCHGIENYSRHLTGREPGEPPPTLLDYFPRTSW